MYDDIATIKYILCFIICIVHFIDYEGSQFLSRNEIPDNFVMPPYPNT